MTMQIDKLVDWLIDWLIDKESRWESENMLSTKSNENELTSLNWLSTSTHILLDIFKLNVNRVVIGTEGGSFVGVQQLGWLLPVTGQDLNNSYQS